jgi:hypothetical protein
MMKALKDYVDSSDPFIATLAKRAKDIYLAKEHDQINQSEFQELAGDIFDLKKIDAAATSLEHKVALEEAADAIMMIIGIAKGVM